MDIIYYDGGILHCEEICFYDTYVIADDIYIVSYAEISKVVSCCEEEQSNEE